MKLTKSSFFLVVLTVLVTCTTSYGNVRQFCSGDIKIVVNDANASVNVLRNNDTIIANSIAQWGLNGDVRSISDCKIKSVTSSKINDKFGKATRVTVKASNGKEQITQNYDIYDGFVMTRLEVEFPSKGSLNYLAPISVVKPYSLFSRAGNYAISVPYDNDAWVRYETSAFGEKNRESYEVTALFNADTRQGLVLGSIEHDIWKTAIDIATSDIATVDTLKVYAGASTVLTRDKRPHGAVSGLRVASPRIIIIPAEDWRQGMETFADQCAIFAPRIASKGPRPFGWNSWGKLASKITFQKAMEVSDFIHDNIQCSSFYDADGKVCINLDSFWNYGFKNEDHPVFVEHCRSNNQTPGIYFCPFTDWGKNPDVVISEMPQYKMGDLYLRVDGKPLEFDGAYALDPTHPATKARIKRALEEVMDWGYEYIKVDFMGHGAFESDTHFDPNVTTGIQAYNQGMAYIDSIIDGKMWINLSIAPAFPANYAHSRRISCDSWADIKNSEYTLNALTNGWWLDHVYHNNDADHIVTENVTDGENRARVTSSAITGVYFLGDDMSEGGLDDTKRRVIRNATNAGINEMARTCDSFRPLEHGNGEHAADVFINENDAYVYLVVYNYSDHASAKPIPLRRLGFSEAKEYKATELWSNDKINLKGQINAEVPAKDVKVYRIEK